MSSKVATVITFEPQDVIHPIYTGGDVALDSEGRILVTCLGEDALLTDVNSGQLLTRVEGVRAEYINRACSMLILVYRMERF